MEPCRIIAFLVVFDIEKMGSVLKDQESNPGSKTNLYEYSPGILGTKWCHLPAEIPILYAHARLQDDGCMAKPNSLKLLYYYIIILLYYYIIISS